MSPAFLQEVVLTPAGRLHISSWPCRAQAKGAGPRDLISSYTHRHVLGREDHIEFKAQLPQDRSSFQCACSTRRTIDHFHQEGSLEGSLEASGPMSASSSGHCFRSRGPYRGKFLASSQSQTNPAPPASPCVWYSQAPDWFVASTGLVPCLSCVGEP